jgi:hypothetical protein
MCTAGPRIVRIVGGVRGLGRGKGALPHLTAPRYVGLAFLVIGLMAPTASADFGPEGGVYGGRSTSPNGQQPRYPFALRLSRTGKQVASARIFYRAQPCASSGESFRAVTVARGMRVRRGGNFGGTDRFSSVSEDGRKLESRISLQGRLGSRVAKGIFRETITVLDASGNAVDRCDTGPTPFSARRGRRVYGGSTGPGFPLALSLSRDRQRVSSLFIMWRAPCEPGSGALDRALQHSGIRIRDGGRISKAGRIAFSTPNGTRYSGRFALSGRVRRRGASGIYRAAVNGTTASGVEFRCNAGRFKWSASRG